jgi:hypothetical protein
VQQQLAKVQLALHDAQQELKEAVAARDAGQVAAAEAAALAAAAATTARRQAEVRVCVYACVCVCCVCLCACVCLPMGMQQWPTTRVSQNCCLI